MEPERVPRKLLNPRPSPIFPIDPRDSRVSNNLACAQKQDNNGQGGCVNPLRSDTSVTEAAPFFQPCQHAAWTYVNDGEADAWGLCQSGHITCCVGTDCNPNPKQPA